MSENRYGCLLPKRGRRIRTGIAVLRLRVEPGTSDCGNALIYNLGDINIAWFLSDRWVSKLWPL